MLQNIRDNVQGVIAKIIIALIIVPFAVFGIDSLFSGSGPTVVAQINGEKLNEQELQRVLAAQKRRLLDQMGDNVDPAMLDDARLRGPALETLIEQKLLLQSAAAADVSVSEQQVDQAIVSLPQFQVDGVFSAELYQNILRSNGYSLSYFKQSMATDLLIQQLTGGVVASDFVTANELETVAAILAQKRDFRYLTLPAAAIRAQISVGEQEVADYYEQHKGEYLREEQVQLAYIELKLSDFFAPVDETRLREAYQSELAAYTAAERRRAAHILIEIGDARSEQQARERAAQVLAKLRDGESFEQLAAEFSDDPGSASVAGDLGFSSGDTFPPEFEQALFALEQDMVSEPVLSEAGLHIIRVTEIDREQAPSFEQRRDQLQAALQAQDAEPKLLAAVEQLRDQVFNSDGLQGPAEELGLTVARSEFFGRGSAAGLFADRRIIAAAFSPDVLNDRNNSDVMELSADHFVVLRVLEHKPQAIKTLAEVQDELRETLRAERATQQLQARAEQLRQRIVAGETVEALAKEAGYEWQVEMNITRVARSVNAALLRAAFALPAQPGDQPVVETVALPNGDVALLKLDRVEPGSLAAMSEQDRSSLAGQLRNNTVSQNMKAYLTSLRANAEIKVL